VLDDVAWLLEIGVAAVCTGVPHSEQNFLPVTSAPQDVQVAIFFGILLVIYTTQLLNFRCSVAQFAVFVEVDPIWTISMTAVEIIAT
jgi:hypothetical protein